MNDPKQQEPDAAANWLALQAELGLVAEEPKATAKESPRAPARQEPAPKPQDLQPPVSLWGSDSAPGNVPLPDESPFNEGAIPIDAELAERSESPGADELDAPAANADHEVEMGEAPEEIPEVDVEPEAEGEKRQRRRRGRRRRRSESGPRDEAAEEPESQEDPPTEESQRDEAVGDEDEEEAELERFADWNVPSWQELIGGLYRPDR
jgi:ribonuclease E